MKQQRRYFEESNFKALFDVKLSFLFAVSGGVRMSCLDEVPLKIPLGFLEELKEEVKIITAPEITVPDYLKILHDTEV